MLDYPLLETLLAVAREGSFGAAGRSLGMSSSAVSQRIRMLEERVGAVTVNRQSPVAPTEFGSILCRHAEQVLLLEDNIRENNREYFQKTNNAPRIIKIAVNDDSLSSWFMEALQHQAHTNPKYLYEISIADQDCSINQMQAGDVLAAISIKKRPIHGFKSIYLGKHIYRATASPEFMSRHFPDGVTLDCLQSAPALRYSSNDDLQRQWIEQELGEVVDPVSYILPSSHGFVDACIKGIAWGMNPALMVDKEIAKGNLIELVSEHTLDKPLYWHFSLVVTEPLKDITESVLRAARKYLVTQEPQNDLQLITQRR